MPRSVRLTSGHHHVQQDEQNPRCKSIEGVLVGEGGFEPPKLKNNRFTVCPLWPLGNSPI